MDSDAFNMSIRNSQMVGVEPQREIEQAIQSSIQSGKVKGDETVPVKGDPGDPG